MNDLISRAEAIREIGATSLLDYESHRAVVEIIESLPSAERRGKWIERDEDCTWECSACGEPWTLIEGTPKQNGMNYCPNCGAKMEGEE